MKNTLSLKKSSDFQRILKRGTWCSRDYLSVYLTKNSTNLNYLGIAVGKKGLTSVERNRIKRLIRESYKNIEKNIKVGYNIIVLWKSKNSFEMASYDRIESDLVKCFEKCKILI